VLKRHTRVDSKIILQAENIQSDTEFEICSHQKPAHNKPVIQLHRSRNPLEERVEIHENRENARTRDVTSLRPQRVSLGNLHCFEHQQ
jgi:hypothetical protein